MCELFGNVDVTESMVDCEYNLWVKKNFHHFRIESKGAKIKLDFVEFLGIWKRDDKVQQVHGPCYGWKCVRGGSIIFEVF